jgi:hypothetical protein
MVDKLTPYDFMGNSPAAVLQEVFQGVYEGLPVEPTEDGAHVLIDDEDGQWIVSIRRVPKISESTKSTMKQEA